MKGKGNLNAEDWPQTPKRGQSLGRALGDRPSRFPPAALAAAAKPSKKRGEARGVKLAAAQTAYAKGK